MSLSYDEFKEGLKVTFILSFFKFIQINNLFLFQKGLGIEIPQEKMDAMIRYLDKDGDGEIVFRY